MYWDPDSPLIVETDTSDHALAAILSTWLDSNVHPIMFHSRVFSSIKLNYDIHDKELLAIFEAFKKWRHYLKGTPVEVFTDHKNLVYFYKSKTLSRRQARWSEFLSQFNLAIKFRPRRLGTKSDALTHYWDVYDGDDCLKSVNVRPIFSQKQHSINLALFLRAATMPDTSALLTDIKSAVLSDSTLFKCLETERDTTNPW